MNRGFFPEIERCIIRGAMIRSGNTSKVIQGGCNLCGDIIGNGDEGQADLVAHAAPVFQCGLDGAGVRIQLESLEDRFQPLVNILRRWPITFDAGILQGDKNVGQDIGHDRNHSVAAQKVEGVG